jgi:hypothetical protein
MAGQYGTKAARMAMDYSRSKRDLLGRKEAALIYLALTICLPNGYSRTSALVKTKQTILSKQAALNAF